MTQPPPMTRAELRTALQVQPTTAPAPAPVGQPRGWRGRAPRAWRVAAPLLALLLWWPAGFSGLDDWFFLPLRARDGDLVLLGATAAAAAIAALVRSAGLRFLLVAAMSGIGWFLGAPSVDGVPGERMVLAVLLTAGGLLGLMLGARGSRGAAPLAVVLALVAGLTPATWPDGPVLAVALALPFVVAAPRQLGAALGRSVGVLVAWLAAEVVSSALGAGWDALQGGLDPHRLGDGLATVGRGAWGFVEAKGTDTVTGLLGDNTPWLVVGLVAALVLGSVQAARAIRAARQARAARASQQPDHTQGAATA